MATASPHRGGQNYAENIIKQGYLKKSVQSSELVTSTAKQIKTNIKQKLEPLRWYVFGVRNRIPYLEYFDREESVFTGQALDTYDLSRFERLSYTMGTSMPVYSFCIYLEDEMVELTAANRVQMTEWCRTLERHLANLGFKVKRGGKEDHTYSDFPIKRPTRHTGLEAERLMEENALAASVLVKEEEEEQENEYEDIIDRKIEAKDENDNNKDLQIPRRPPKANQSQEVSDDVFASLYSVKRDTLTLDPHNKEEDSVECDISENLTTNLELNEDRDTLKHMERDLTQYNKELDDEGNERCLSLPIMPFDGAGSTGDTSEDSDFIGASFWLRNRKTEDLILFDVTDAETAKRKLPPQPSNQSSAPPVPRRLESMKGPSLRHSVSMNEKLFTKKPNKGGRISPTLEALGQAPAPKTGKQQISKSPELPKRILTGTTFKDSESKQLINTSPELPKRIVSGNVNKDSESKQLTGLSPKLPKRLVPEKYENDPGKQSNDIKIKAITRLEQVVNDNLEEDEVGDYETSPNRKQNGLSNGTEDIYEPAWMCTSHRDTSPHKEKQFVDMPDDFAQCSKKDQNKSSKTKETVKSKKKFQISFSRKSKSYNIPSELSLSVNSRHNSSEEGADGNFYSDLPGDFVPKITPKTPEAANSDLCKISLENGPSRSVETSPVLPRRNKGTQSSRSSVFSRPSHDDPPSPPRKTGGKSNDDCDFMMRRNKEAPVAPPRRNRKTIHGDVFYSSTDGKHKTVINNLSQSTDGKLYQPKRDLPPLPKGEPFLPPRDGKPALPPPRKSDESEHLRPDVPARPGTRPKSINITKRQFSTETTALTVMNLKQNQVDILRSEIEMTNGMMKTVSKNQFQSGLALVECFERIWIAGWDLKNFPRLFDKFHIGDQLIAINDVHVSDIDFVTKLVKNVKVDTIDVIIKRLPMARVFALQRSAEGQNLGFKRDGGTAEIAYVDPHGIAANHGLPPKANTMDFSCNWWLTEINMRPLNLFFKENEIEHRLMAVGKDISIVVQPSDFVKDLRKQLKKVKGYKDYLVQ